MAVDDSPAALAAVDVAVKLAARTGAAVRFVHVVADGEVGRALTRLGRDKRETGSGALASQALLRHVVPGAERAGVPADTLSRAGDPVPLLLDAARE